MRALLPQEDRILLYSSETHLPDLLLCDAVRREAMSLGVVQEVVLQAPPFQEAKQQEEEVSIINKAK